jgi:AcrR family transcriptional regulator
VSVLVPRLTSAGGRAEASPESLVSGARKRTPYALAAREFLRGTIFDAAREELARRRWSQVTMTDVAVAAGVSRQTLYTEFGSREAFARALVLSVSDRLIAAVEGAMDEHLDDPRAALLAAFELFLSAVAADPLARAAITGDGEMLLPVTTRGGSLLERSTERLKSAIISRWPQIETRDAALLAECLVRLAISYGALPAGPAGAAASSIVDLLGPYLERTLGAGIVV